MQAPLWVQTKSPEEIKNQHDLGNSKQFTAFVDGSHSKAISQAQRKVVVHFVSAVLTRALHNAKSRLQKNILASTTRRTGLLADGWTWFLQVGGKGGNITPLGDSLPGNLRLRPGDALILAPGAGYAWFGNSAAVRGYKKKKLEQREKEAIKFQLTGKRRRGRPIGANPKGRGFMAKTATSLRRELKMVGFNVVASNAKVAPPGPSAGWGSTIRGVPILVFWPSRTMKAERG